MSKCLQPKAEGIYILVAMSIAVPTACPIFLPKSPPRLPPIKPNNAVNINFHLLMSTLIECTVMLSVVIVNDFRYCYDDVYCSADCCEKS